MPPIVLFFFGALVSMFSITNPLIAAPVFVSLTGSMSAAEKRELAWHAALNVFFILTLFFICGSLILGVFGISIDALKIGGGLMILASAFGMLNKRERLLPEEREEARERDDIAFSPLAMPMMSGPGAIAVIIGLTSDASTPLHLAAIMVVILLVCLCAYVILRLSERLLERMGKTLVKAVTRIMGFILLCVGVQYIVNGIEGIVIGLSHQLG